MTQQEIKANLPQLPLQTYYIDAMVIDHNGNHILTTATDTYSHTTDSAVDLAIVHAINNTYDKGINPESVPDMFNVLNTICYYLHDIEEDKMYNIVKDILKNATL
jgi:hypothetical protein